MRRLGKVRIARIAMTSFLGLAVASCGLGGSVASEIPKGPGIHIPAETQELSAVKCVDTTSSCFAVGGDDLGHGIVLKSTGSLRAWRSIPIPTLGTLDGIDCPTSTSCYAAGGGTQGSVIVTQDGGARWTSFPLPDVAVSSLACPSANRCIVAGYEAVKGGSSTTGVLLLSSDAGRSWSRISSGGTLSDIEGLSCQSTVCVAVGSKAAAGGDTLGTALVTSDAGESWSASNLPAEVDLISGGLRGASCFQICVTDGSGFPSQFALKTGKLPSSSELIFITSDGGASWKLGDLPLGQTGRTAGPVFCEAEGCLMDQSSLANSSSSILLKSLNSGSSWYVAGAVSPASILTGLSCIGRSCVAVGRVGDERFGAALGHAVLAVSRDLGASWTTVQAG